MKFIGEILHFNAVRMRVTGSGNLLQYLHSLDNVNTVQLANISMNTITNIEPTSLADYKDQRGQLELKTIALNDTFNISRIIIFIKPLAVEYPR
jgi:hypothetical protein